LELLSLFPDGIYFEDFKEFYNKKKTKINQMKNDKKKMKILVTGFKIFRR
jgi:hypothetical protein